MPPTRDNRPVRAAAQACRRLLPLCLLAGAAGCLASSSIEDMRSNDAVHGLYEIREEARRFVAEENAGRDGEWQAGDPNLKVFVPRCAVPLKARWHAIRWFDTSRNADLVPRSRRVIAVVCGRSASPAQQQWTVHVPVSERKPVR